MQATQYVTYFIKNIIRYEHARKLSVKYWFKFVTNYGNFHFDKRNKGFIYLLMILHAVVLHHTLCPNKNWNPKFNKLL